MAKPNKNNKLRCERYKAQGRREINKKKKAERNEKRIAKFAKRREEGKAYEYVWLGHEPEVIDGDPKSWRRHRDWEIEKAIRAGKNTDHKTPYARMVSNRRKLKNELDAEILAEKRKEAEKDKKKNK